MVKQKFAAIIFLIFSRCASFMQVSDLDKLKQHLVQQEKELMEIKEKKLMLELEQTKQKLDAKQKEMKQILVSCVVLF